MLKPDAKVSIDARIKEYIDKFRQEFIITHPKPVVDKFHIYDSFKELKKAAMELDIGDYKRKKYPNAHLIGWFWYEHCKFSQKYFYRPLNESKQVRFNLHGKRVYTWYDVKWWLRHIFVVFRY